MRSNLEISSVMGVQEGSPVFTKAHTYLLLLTLHIYFFHFVFLSVQLEIYIFYFNFWLYYLK